MKNPLKSLRPVSVFEINLRFRQPRRLCRRIVNPSPSRILVVDDSGPLREMLTAVIRGHGFDVDAVSSGEEAVNRQRSVAEPYLAVLLDLTLPGMDVAATLVGLREVGLTAPVILMSGLENSKMLGRMSQLHYSQFLQKPLNPESILRAIRTSVRRARQKSGEI